jgi:hypothetical protein
LFCHLASARAYVHSNLVWMVTDLTGEDTMKTDMVLAELCLSMLEEALITNSGGLT